METFIKSSIVVFLILLFLTLIGITYLGITFGRLRVDPNKRTEMLIKIDMLNSNLGRSISRQDSLLFLENELLELLKKEKIKNEYGSGL